MKSGVSVSGLPTPPRARGELRSFHRDATSVVLVASLQTSHSCAPPSPSGVRARARGYDARFAVARDADRGRRSRRHVHAGVLASARVLAPRARCSGGVDAIVVARASRRRGDGCAGGGGPRTHGAFASSHEALEAWMTRDVPPAPSAAPLGDDPPEPAESPDASPPRRGFGADARPALGRRRGVSSSAPSSPPPRARAFANARVRLAGDRVRGAPASARRRSPVSDPERAALPDELLDAVRESLVESASAARDAGGSGTRAAVMDGTARFERLLASIQSDTERRSPPRSPSRLFARPDAPAVLLVPGLFARYYPRYLEDVREHLEARGATVRVSIAADGEGTVHANAAALRDEILQFANELDENKLPPLVGEGEGGDRDEFIHGARVPKGVSDARLCSNRRTTQRRIVLVGHSKGACDAARAARFPPPSPLASRASWRLSVRTAGRRSRPTSWRRRRPRRSSAALSPASSARRPHRTRRRSWARCATSRTRHGAPSSRAIRFPRASSRR